MTGVDAAYQRARANFRRAEFQAVRQWARKELAAHPSDVASMGLLGMSSVAVGDWRSGWDLLERASRLRFGADPVLGALPWEGEPVDRLLIIGEQGIGDQILRASMIADALDRVGHATIVCAPKLARLFARSFPRPHVVPKGDSSPLQGVSGQFDAHTHMLSLSRHFRPTPASCPRHPYLFADPVRRQYWRSYFDAVGAPAIGIAWSGGTPTTGATQREIGLAAFTGLISRTPATFVSLQYRRAEEEIQSAGLPVRQYAETLVTADYDETASLVAELDFVIGPPTAVMHLAGSLGVPSMLLVPRERPWDITGGTCSPWFADQQYLHQGASGGDWARRLGNLRLPKFARRARPIGEREGGP